MRPITVLATGVVVLVGVLFLFDSHLLSERCDKRIVALTANQERAAKHIKELQQALSQSAETLEKMRSRSTASTLHRQLQDEVARVHRRGHETATAAESPPPPSPSPPVEVEQPVASMQQTLATGDPSQLSPRRIAVVVIAYNRPQYLDRALKSIFSHHPGSGFPIYISQDGENAEVARVAEKHGARRLVHPRKLLKFKPGTYIAKFPGYSYLAVHYGWALGTLFDDAEAFEGVIVLEEDIEVAPDFFNYFTATAPLLYQDDSLLCVSAFNDNGQQKFASDPSALYRSDFFPGLGWLITRRLWAELGPKWPGEAGFWDDWLREPPQRRGRASIRPEVSRTYTFGEKGTSQGQFSKFLRDVRLGSGKSFDVASDTRYLLKPTYDEAFKLAVDAATSIPFEQLLRGGPGSESTADVVVSYSSAKEYVSMCKRLGVMEDLKAGVPRTGYQGVVTLRMGGRRVFLAPSYPLLDVPNGKIVKDGQRV